MGDVMNIDLMRQYLLWTMIINYGFVFSWWLVFRFWHDSLYRLHRRWFQLSVAQFDAIHYAGMAVYKIGILLLNVAPYLALRLLHQTNG